MDASNGCLSSLCSTVCAQEGEGGRQWPLSPWLAQHQMREGCEGHTWAGGWKKQICTIPWVSMPIPGLLKLSY